MSTETSVACGAILLVRDFPAAVGFYESVLGLTAQGSPPQVQFKTRSGTLTLVDGTWWRANGGSEYSPFSGVEVPNVVLMIQVQDLEEEFERLARVGVRFLSVPTARPRIGLRNAFLRDPDGRVVMLASVLP